MKLKSFLVFVYNRIRFPFDCRFSISSKISKNSHLEGMCQLARNTELVGRLGYGSYICDNSRIYADVGRFTSIAQNVNVILGRHPYKSPYVSTSPCFYVTNPGHIQNGDSFCDSDQFVQYKYADAENQIFVKIGNDCWVGQNVSIIQGVTVADGVVILANAVVTKDVPPYAIVGGVPAKVIGYRYDEETIQFLLKTSWWNNEPQWFRLNWKLMSDINQLKEYYRTHGISCK